MRIRIAMVVEKRIEKGRGVIDLKKKIRIIVSIRKDFVGFCRIVTVNRQNLMKNLMKN